MAESFFEQHDRDLAAKANALTTNTYSTTGTRTRVARVKAEYPSQLDYSGSADLALTSVVKVSSRGHAKHKWRGGAPQQQTITTRRQAIAYMVPRGLEPRTLRLLAVRSNQLSYETTGYHVGM